MVGAECGLRAANGNVIERSVGRVSGVCCGVGPRLGAARMLLAVPLVSRIA